MGRARGGAQTRETRRLRSGLRCLLAVGMALASVVSLAQVPEPLLPGGNVVVQGALPPPDALPLPAADTGSGVQPADALEAFIDGVVGAYMAEAHIAGVVVAVVDRDGTLLQKGYGIAGVDPDRAVDPASTLFRIGSISKTFTYLAAMQLVAQQRIRLDDAANSHLPQALQIPDEGYGAVSVADLMQHTAGFEESALGHLFMRNAAAVPALADYLAKYRPRRVRPPGLHAVYSNYAVGLLGALVAEASGMPFEDYVQTRLLTPLHIATITFREPLVDGDPRRVGPDLAGTFSTGFQREAGGYSASGFEFIAQLAPAGGASASAAGMARWMRMLLNGGHLDGATVLDPASFAQLAEIGFRNADAVGGIAHGFFRQRYGQHLSLEHAGATLHFLSNMVVLPDAGIGVFVSTNTDTGRGLAMALPRLVFEHWLPDARTPIPVPTSAAAADLARYAGTYRSERRPYRSLEKFLMVAGTDTAVSPGPDGTLVVATGDGAHRHVAQGDGVFRNLDDGSRIAFTPQADGGMTLAAGYGHVVADRIGAIDLMAALVAAIAAVTLLSIGVLIGGWHRRALRQRLRHGRAAATTLGLAAVLWLAWIIAAAVALAIAASSSATLVYDYPGTSLKVAVVLAHVAAAATVLAVLAFWPALRARDWSTWRKLRHMVVLLVMAFAVVLLVRWNVLLAPIALA